MVQGTPTDRSYAKEIMIAYISALGPASEHLFRKEDSRAPINKSFAEAWETILKTLSDQH
jgi:hypothetical protein